MDLEESINRVNKRFKYRRDASIYLLPESWRIIGSSGEGDCEDYSLTVIWEYSNRNVLKWLWHVGAGDFELWHCKSPRGVGHLITKQKSTDLWFDNITRRPVTRAEVDKMGYRLIFWYPMPFSYLKIFLGYTLGSVGRLIHRI